MARRKLHTRLCDVLEIEYPIIQAGMGGFSDPPLVIAVSEAGGLGTLGGAVYEPDTLDAAIREIRKGTSKPFAIDLLLPDSLKDMEGISKEGLMKYIPDDYFEYAKELRKKFNIPDDFYSTRGGALWTSEGTMALIQVCLDNKVPVLAAGLGRLGDIMPECKSRGIKTIAIGANVRMSLKHVEDQVDVIVAQGYDAGGHTGNIGTLAVVPQIADAVKPIPVAAAGGIADGRGLVAALALGAVGVWCGSMFLLSPEATFTEGQKDRVIAATERDAVITKAISGKTMRQLRTPYTEIWDKGPKPPLGWPFHMLLTLDIVDYAYEHADQKEFEEMLVTPAGQATRLLNRRRTAKQIIDDMVEEAVTILEQGLPKTAQWK
ncbi:MAG: nitronate monooxygenase [Dehalococcoidia bacterium]|nr:MAG: nitronate monooxygenase [Dehalococcoidia bacterium]